MTLSFAPDRIERWPLAKLQPYARNAKAHGDSQITMNAEFERTVTCILTNNAQLVAGLARMPSLWRPDFGFIHRIGWPISALTSLSSTVAIVAKAWTRPAS